MIPLRLPSLVVDCTVAESQSLANTHGTKGRGWDELRQAVPRLHVAVGAIGECWLDGWLTAWDKIVRAAGLVVERAHK